MGQKAKNAGKKKQMPPKKKVSCLPRDLTFKISDTPEAHYAFRELFSSSNRTLSGKKCGGKTRNYNVLYSNTSLCWLDLPFFSARDNLDTFLYVSRTYQHD